MGSYSFSMTLSWISVEGWCNAIFWCGYLLVKTVFCFSSVLLIAIFVYKMCVYTSCLTGAEQLGTLIIGIWENIHSQNGTQYNHVYNFLHVFFLKVTPTGVMRINLGKPINSIATITLDMNNEQCLEYIWLAVPYVWYSHIFQYGCLTHADLTYIVHPTDLQNWWWSLIDILWCC